MKKSALCIIPAMLALIIGMAAALARNAQARQSIAVGDSVFFGHYPQNGDGTDHTPIEWLVLDVQGNKSLLISRCALDSQPYDSAGADTTWQECSLRAWLNETFIDRAFTGSEQKGILTTAVDNGPGQGDSGYRTTGGNDTEDKIFLLSYAEAWKYFGDDKARRCAPTEYAVSQGAQTNNNYKVDGKAACWWWLRSPGYYQCDTILVHYDGSRSYGGAFDSRGGVRPALWVDPESGLF